MFVIDHAKQQIKSRFGKNSKQIIRTLEASHYKAVTSEDWLVYKLGRMYNLKDGSNGDCLVVVVKGSAVMTVFLRRKEQLDGHGRNGRTQKIVWAG